MRGTISAIALTLSAPLLAQTDAQKFVTAYGRPDERRLLSGDQGREPAVAVNAQKQEAIIRRIGAWGRCVVKAEPATSLAVVRNMASDAGLASAFDTCGQVIGGFRSELTPAIRRAAIQDALALR